MIVYLCGDEPYFIKQNMVRLEKDAEVRRTSALEAEDLMFLQMGGFFGHHVLTLHKDSYSEKDIETIKGLGIESSSNTLVLTGKIAKNSKFYKWIDKVGTVVSCDRLSEKDGPVFCARILKSYGARIKPEAAMLFMERTGYYLKSGDLFMVRNALRQLSLMSDGITEEVVMQFPQSEVVNRWKIVGLLGTDTREFVKRMVQAERSGESAIGLLSIILRAFRIAYKCKVFGEGNEALSAVGITSYQFRDIRWIVQDCSLEQIERSLTVLNQAVREQKSAGDRNSSFIRALGNLIEVVHPAHAVGE